MFPWAPTLILAMRWLAGSQTGLPPLVAVTAAGQGAVVARHCAKPVSLCEYVGSLAQPHKINMPVTLIL